VKQVSEEPACRGPDEAIEKKMVMDHLLLRLLGTDDYNFRFYLRECLARFPLADLKSIVYEKNLHVVATMQNAVVSAEPVLYDAGKGDRVLIVFATNFSKCKPHETLYIIAHEFAHVFLGHYDRANWKGEESEVEADRQVVKWGFERELRESGFSYLKTLG
jgi:hypothetical protein